MVRESVLRVSGLSKDFGNTKALVDVSFDLAAGERLAVLGENGAGKSTLMKILAGVHRPGRGQMELAGEAFAPKSPAQAAAAGVSIVFQEPSYFAHLSVLENLFIGREPLDGLGQMAWARMRHEATQAFGDLDLDPAFLDREMGSLSLAEQQMVLIARAVSSKCRVIILDEPTSILTAQEAEQLFAATDRLVASGVAVLYITHRLDELPRIADRFIVLKDGAMVGDLSAEATDHDAIIELMSGRPVGAVSARVDPQIGDVLLRIDRLTYTDQFEDVSLDIRAGEVIGLYGLVGAGRTELALTIFGDQTPTSGAMVLAGEPYAPRTSRDAINAGIAYVPEDRRTQGLFPYLTTAENITATVLERHTRAGLLNLSALTNFAKEQIAAMRIKVLTPNDSVMSLSGGHQQKSLLARWLATGPRLAIFDEPTRGIDVGTKTEIQSQVMALADEGVAVVVISSELPELLAVSDRICVMREGRVAAELTGDQRTESAVLRATLGVTSDVSGVSE